MVELDLFLILNLRIKVLVAVVSGLLAAEDLVLPVDSAVVAATIAAVDLGQ